jgi:hypothetical protein
MRENREPKPAAHLTELFGSEWEIILHKAARRTFPWLDGPHAIRFSKTARNFGECLYRATEAKDETGWP